MVIMDEVKEERSGSQTGKPKKTCPRAARENAKKNEISSLKTAHSGLRFHFDKKKLVAHEFSFNSVSKAEKVTRYHHEEKSAGKETKVESSSTADSKKIEVLMDTLKISRSEGCSSSREKSPLRTLRKEMPKSPVVERLTSKKGCTKCSRCSRTPKEEKSEMNPLKMAKEQEKSLKATKKENSSTKTVKLTPKAQQSPKPVKKQCSKLAKLQVEPSEKSVKPKSILVHNEKPALKDNEKNDVSKNNEAPQSPKPCKKQCSKLARLLAEPEEKNMNAKSGFVHTEKSHSRVNESNNVSKIYEKASSTMMKSIVVKSHSEMEKKVEFAWPSSGNPEVMIPSSETPHAEGKSEIVNGSEHPAILDMRVCLSNGSHDEHLCDPHLGLESPGGTRRDLISKIPRKTHGAAGLKPDGSLSKDTMPEELIAL